MAHTNAPAVVEIYHCEPTGMRIEMLDYCTNYEYALLANDAGPFKIKLPFTFNRKNVKLDNIIEIWRGHEPGTLKMEYCGFVRGWKFGDEAGLAYTELSGFSSLELLRSRIVKDYAGSAQAKMTNEAGDMIKAICKDQLGSDTVAARDLTSVGGGFTIQKDLVDGVSITKEFAYKNVLSICREIADASKQAGTEIYFDLVPVYTTVTTGMIGFQIKTFADQRGMDRTFDSDNPAYIGLDWGNLENGSLEYDYSDEINYAYVLGQGEGASREVVEQGSTTRMGKSIWNRREGMKDARNVEYGDTAGLTGEAQTFLDENKPRLKFSGDIVETPAFRYGHDWGFGDKVTVVYAGMEKDANINKVIVKRNENGQETITAKLNIEE